MAPESAIVIVFAREEERTRLALQIQRATALSADKPLPNWVFFVQEGPIRKHCNLSLLPTKKDLPLNVIFSRESSNRITSLARVKVTNAIINRGCNPIWSDKTGQDLANIDIILKSLGHHINVKLAKILDEFHPRRRTGTQCVTEWTANFSRIGATGIGDLILSAIEIYNPELLARGLRLDELPSDEGTVCVLGQKGSDLLITKMYQERFDQKLPTLREFLENNNAGSNSATLLVDYVHSGDQLALQITGLTFPKKMHLIIRPFHATRTGISSASKRISNIENLTTKWDLGTTIIVENNPHNERLTQLELRLQGHRYNSNQINKVLSVCQKIGRELRAYDTDGNAFNMNGLGHEGLGLTSFTINSISKAVLPVLRLGSEVRGGDWLVNGGTQTFESWMALIYHANSCGTG